MIKTSSSSQQRLIENFLDRDSNAMLVDVIYRVNLLIDSRINKYLVTILTIQNFELIVFNLYV